MSYTIIQTLLDARLQEVVGLPALQLENTRYEPKTGTAFVRASFQPVESARMSTSYDLAQGIYVIDIFYPADKGTATASAMADLVKAQFPRTLLMASGGTSVHIKMSSRAPAQTFQQFYQVPVIVSWESQQAKS